jgi:hypothetical protein
MPQDKLSYPLGAADQQAPAYAAVLAVTITNQLTILKVLAMSGAMTINVTVDPQVRPGAELQLILQSDATARTTTLGTAIDGPNIVGVISKTMSQSFTLDTDGVFKPKGSFAQVD